MKNSSKYVKQYFEPTGVTMDWVKKSAKIDSMQRVGGRCKPTRYVEYSSSPSRRENGEVFAY